MQGSILPLLSPVSQEMTPSGSHSRGGQLPEERPGELDATNLGAALQAHLIIAQSNRSGAVYGKNNRPRSRTGKL